jgi:hypothetical protein
MKDYIYRDTGKSGNAKPGGHMSNQLDREHTNSSTTGLKRRRLLKGAALVPAIYTLQTGSARAMLSSHRCIANTQEQPGKPFTLVDDKWKNFRFKHDAITVAQVETSKTDFLIEGRINYYDLSGRIWREKEIVDGVRSFEAPNGTEYKEVLGNTHPVYARVYVDDEGQIVRVGNRSSGGTAVHDSCWTSFT